MAARSLPLSSDERESRGVITERGAAHLHNWDRLRVFASLDIVGSHLGGEHLFAGVGTPLFLMLTIGFAVQRPTAGDTRAFVHKRVQRVLIPWLVWSLVIAACLSGWEWSHARPALGWWKPEMLLYGSQIHLWFLPVGATLGLCAHLLQRASAPHTSLALGAAACALGVVNLALCPRLGRGWPFEQWSFSLPSLWLGFGLGRLLSLCERDARAQRWTVAVLSTSVAGCLLLGLIDPLADPYTRRYAGALALLAACALLPNVPDRVTPKLAALMLGTYILHPIVFLLGVEPGLRALGFAGVVWARVACGYLATLALVALLRRTFVRRLL